MFQRADRGLARLAGQARQLAEAVERPQRVQRRAVQPDLVDRRVAHQREQLRDDVLLAALDEQPLRVQPPQHVVGGQRRDQAGGVVLRQRQLLLRRRAPIDDAVDPAARLVAHRRLVGVAGAVAEVLRGRIVLADEVVPVGHPHRAVGTDLRLHRGHPLLGAGEQVPAIAGHEPGAALLDDALPDQVRGRLVDERDPVPVPAWGTRARCRADGRRPRCSRRTRRPGGCRG